MPRTRIVERDGQQSGRGYGVPGIFFNSGPRISGLPPKIGPSLEIDTAGLNRLSPKISYSSDSTVPGNW